MNKRILAASVAFTCALGATAPQAVADVPLTVNVGASRWFYTSDHEIENMDALQLGLEWAFTDAWAAELSYSADDAEEEMFGGDADMTHASLGALYYLGSYRDQGMRFRPYGAAGVGYYDIDPDGDLRGSEDSATLYAGGGVRWMLTQRFGARLDYRVHYGFDESTWDSVLTAGINWYFGDVSPMTPPPPPAPVDSDGDGVPDDRDRCPGTPAGTRVDADGCPLPVAQVASIKLKVNFGFDSTKVQEKFFSDLGELAAFLKRFEDVQVDVEGHTDSTGPEDYNQQLSQRRAQAVVDYLVNEHGIDRSRLEPKGYGESQPVASNDTKEGRAENRRVMATLEVEYEE